MTSPRPGPRRARIASVLAALALVFVGLGLPASRADAADPAAATVTLTAAAVDGTTLSVSGQVTNTGTGPLTDVTVALWRSTGLLRSSAAVEGALAAEQTTTGTARVIESTNAVALASGDGVLEAGQSRSFTVSGSLAALGITAVNATWWVGADVTARPADASLRTVASARTLVTNPDGDVPIVTVIELSSVPRQLKDSLFLDEGLADELDGGRLDALLTLVEEQNTSWLIDPSLLVELRDMADGYRVQTSDGNTPGLHAEAAQAFLARVAALPTAQGSQGLVGSPDVTAVAALDDPTLTSVLGQDATASLDVLRVTVIDAPTPAALTLAATWGHPLVLVDADTSAPHVTVAGTDAVTARTAAQETPASSLLPTTALTASAARFARARVAGGEVRWVREPDAMPSTDLPHGFTAATLTDIWALPASTLTLEQDSDPGTTLDADAVTRALGIRDRMLAYGEVAPDTGIGTLADTQGARVASRWWTDDADARDAWLAGIERRIGPESDPLVTLDAAHRFSLAGASSEFPVTVTNHLSDPVTVQVVASSDNPQRIRLTTPDAVTIPAGASSTVLLRAEAAGGGLIQGTVHVATVNGHRLTSDRTIIVETTSIGLIGWVLVIASGVVLVVTTARRIRYVRDHGKGEDG